LPFDLVALLHGSVQEPRRVEDLEPPVAALEVPDAHALRGERIRCDLGLPRGDRPDQGALPHVRISGDHDRGQLRVEARDLPERDAGLHQGVQVPGHLADDGREAADGLLAEALHLLDRGAADAPRVLSGKVLGLARRPVDGSQVLAELVPVHQEVDELTVERRELLQGREALHVSVEGALEGLSRGLHLGNGEVPRAVRAVAALRGRLGRPAQRLV